MTPKKIAMSHEPTDVTTTTSCLACDRDFYRPETQSHSRDKRVLMVVFFTAHMLAHLRHLPRFPDFFVTFRILSPFSGNRMFVYARLLPKT